jgi:hypothetical protein
MMGAETVSYADVVAGVRTAIARYAQAVDDGRAADVVATFCPDGSADIPGAGIITGPEALLGYFAGLRPRGRSRHVVVNTDVTEWNAGAATAVSDLIVLGRTAEAGWAVQLVGRYDDLLHSQDGCWRFHSRTLRFAD